MTCPTCGSPYKGSRNELSAWDADIPFKNRPVGKNTAQSVFDDKLWYCGPCPDAWHDDWDKDFIK